MKNHANHVPNCASINETPEEQLLPLPIVSPLEVSEYLFMQNWPALTDWAMERNAGAVQQLVNFVANTYPISCPPEFNDMLLDVCTRKQDWDLAVSLPFLSLVSMAITNGKNGHQLDPVSNKPVVWSMLERYAINSPLWVRKQTFQCAELLLKQCDSCILWETWIGSQNFQQYVYGYFYRQRSSIPALSYCLWQTFYQQDDLCIQELKRTGTLNNPTVLVTVGLFLGMGNRTIPSVDGIVPESMLLL
jgi:hypothetical protein